MFWHSGFRQGPFHLMDKEKKIQLAFLVEGLSLVGRTDLTSTDLLHCRNLWRMMRSMMLLMVLWMLSPLGS